MFTVIVPEKLQNHWQHLSEVRRDHLGFAGRVRASHEQIGTMRNKEL